MQRIKEEQYPEELIEESLPNFLQQVRILLQTFDLTGVYIAKLEFPNIEVDALNDEQYAHLDVNNPKVLKYIGANDNHNFIKNIAVSQDLVRIICGNALNLESF